jgi:hypothetical protein
MGRHIGSGGGWRHWVKIFGSATLVGVATGCVSSVGDGVVAAISWAQFLAVALDRKD